MRQEMTVFGQWQQSAPHSRQITTPTPHHSILTVRMLFMTPKQQYQECEMHCNRTELPLKCRCIVLFSVSALATSLWVHDVKDAAAEAHAPWCQHSGLWCPLAGPCERGRRDNGLGFADKSLRNESDVCVECLTIANWSYLCTVNSSLSSHLHV